MQKSKSQAVQRDYNIITGEPSRFVTGPTPSRGSVVDLPRIHNARQEFIREKQKDNFKLQDIEPVRNDKPFQNVVNHMRESKTYATGLPSKINSQAESHNYNQRSLINSPSVDYNFISYTIKKDPSTLQSLVAADPNVVRRKAPISGFGHVGRVTSPNFNPNYQELYKNDTGVFKKKQGLGGGFLDSAHSYGALTRTFKRAGK